MPKHLIVNADDYGRTAAISAGIRHTHLNGIVTTTTTMMNFPTAADDVRIAQAECPRLGLGVHLTLTSGRPVLSAAQVSTLVDGDGAFFKLPQLPEVYARANPAELRAEWRAQIEKFLATGATLDHLDSHHHASYFNETVFGLMLDLANEYRAPVRCPDATDSAERAGFTERLLAAKRTRCPDHFIVTFYDRGATLPALLNLLNTLPEGLTEIMSHPGYVDEEILSGSIYNRQREEEIKILTSPEVKQTLEAQSIQLYRFRDAL